MGFLPSTLAEWHMFNTGCDAVPMYSVLTLVALFVPLHFSLTLEPYGVPLSQH
jgi:hypothetical protein